MAVVTTARAIALPRVSAERLAVVAGLGALAMRIPSLDLPILEWHGWRQTWTAYTALLFHQDGIDLLHPKLPIFGPPFEVPMEFPLQQALASLVMDAGVAPDLAMRLTNLAFFFVSAALLYGLMRRIAGPVAALAGLVFFLFVPTNLLWSRASLVEYGATAGAIGFLWAGLVWRETRRRRIFALALAAGILGMLVKPTTPVFWTVPLVLWRVPGEPRDLVGWLRVRLDPALVALCLVPTAVAYGWTKWADAIKGAQEAAAFMTSSATSTFYYATIGERFDPAIWQRTWSWISGYLVGVGMLPVLGLGLWAAWRSRRPAFWGGVVLAAALPVAIFYGGYYKHDYYWSALTPEVAMLVGIGVAWLVARATTLPRRAVVTVALVLAAVLSLQSSRVYWSRMYPPLDDFEGVLPRASELAANSRPSDLVVVVGRAYDPDLVYEARRKALMLTIENETGHLLEQAARGDYSILFAWDPAGDQISAGRYWTWMGVIAPHTYAIGAAPSAMRDAPILATDDVGAVPASARELQTQPLHIPCDLVSHGIPAGPQGTWLRIEPSQARVWVSPLYAPVPVRSIIAIDPSVTFGAATAAIYCDGAPEIVVDRIVAAPLPPRH